MAMIKIDDDTVDALVTDNLKQCYIDCVSRAVTYKYLQIDNQDSEFNKDMIDALQTVLRFYMPPQDAEAFIIDVARGEHADHA
jgi:hypothetical protein